MPAYYEMLVSQSPPLFSNSPPTGFLSEYSPNRYYESPRFCRSASMLTPPQARRFLQPPQSLYHSHLQSLTPFPPKMPLPAPKRSCINLNNHNCDNCDEDICDSVCETPIRQPKKRVVFADEEGLELEHVKIMSESSNQPPVWSLQFLAHVTQGMISPVPQEQWTIDFSQPASDYLEFRRKLETNNVSLENVIIKESESTVVGTVKVKNLSFHKEVFIRSSWDGWKSQTDTFCTYSQIVGASCAYVIYDTFSFKLTLPPNTRNLEFCVGFRADDKEFWDNNQGVNYKLTNKVSVRQEERLEEYMLGKLNTKNGQNKENAVNKSQSSPVDMPKPRYGTWSEFSSRTETLLPYW